MSATSEVVVWWVSDAEADWLMQLQPERPFGWRGLFENRFSGYFREELEDRNGRAGRGRLWVNERFGNIETLPGLPTAFDCGSYAGIIVSRWDLGEVPVWLGVVTDCDGNILTEFSRWKPDPRFPAGVPNPRFLALTASSSSLDTADHAGGAAQR